MTQKQCSFDSISDFEKKILPRSHRETLVNSIFDNPKETGTTLGKELVETIQNEQKKDSKDKK